MVCYFCDRCKKETDRLFLVGAATQQGKNVCTTCYDILMAVAEKPGVADAAPDLLAACQEALLDSVAIVATGGDELPSAKMIREAVIKAGEVPADTKP